MSRKKKRLRNSPQRSPAVSVSPDHYYVICSQDRAIERRGAETFWVAKGPVWKSVGMFPTRSAARKAIRDQIANSERGNPFAGHQFYWAKRVDLPPAN